MPLTTPAHPEQRAQPASSKDPRPRWPYRGAFDRLRLSGGGGGNRNTLERTCLSPSDPIAEMAELADGRRVKVFLHLRRFVDWDLSRGPSVGIGNLTILAVIVPWLAVLPLRNIVDRTSWAFVLWSTATLSVLWIGFVAWRGWRLFRASALRSDKAFDREERFGLSSDYHESESSTKARRRRQNGG